MLTIKSQLLFSVLTVHIVENMQYLSPNHTDCADSLIPVTPLPHRISCQLPSLTGCTINTVLLL